MYGLTALRIDCFLGTIFHYRAVISLCYKLCVRMGQLLFIEDQRWKPLIKL